VSRDSGEPESERLERLRELYPEVFAEGRVDLAKLATVLGDDADERPERHSFSWAGKCDAIRLLQVPSRAARTPGPSR
jgi:adenine-specific DNA-methyltransferase